MITVHQEAFMEHLVQYVVSHSLRMRYTLLNTNKNFKKPLVNVKV